LPTDAPPPPAADPSAAPGTEVRLQVEPPSATVGDPVTVVLSADAPPFEAVTFPDPGATWGKLTVLERFHPGAQDLGAVRRHSATYRVAAFETGEIEIPPLEVTIGEGEGARVVATPAASLSVRSVLQGSTGAETIADLKPPWSLPAGIPWGAIAVAAVALAALAWGVARLLRRRPAGAPPPIPELPADEEALAALDLLQARALITSEEMRAFHVQLAEIVKRYLSRRLGIPTLERTSLEVVEGARARRQEAWLVERIEGLLRDCDAVKFARDRRDEPAARASAGCARDLVVRTRPDRPADAAPAAAPAEG